MAAPKLKACDSKVKDKFGKPGVCGVPIFMVDGRFPPCKNRGNHHTKLRTGFCLIGRCEGTKSKDHNGVAAPTCKFWATCGCKCHLVYDQMFAMSDMERIAVDNSGYSVDHGGFAPIEIIVREPVGVLSSAGGTDDGPVYESPAPGVVPAVRARSFAPTPSGRAARGELEYDVKRAIDIFIVEGEDGYCTPSWISTEIGREKGIDPPSTGAVTAVLDRWVACGFAVTAKKPSRFVEYTPEGIELGLDVLKERYKRRSKMAKTAVALGRRD